MVSFGLYSMWIWLRFLQFFSGHPLEMRAVLPDTKGKINTDRHPGSGLGSPWLEGGSGRIQAKTYMSFHQHEKLIADQRLINSELK